MLTLMLLFCDIAAAELTGLVLSLFMLLAWRDIYVNTCTLQCRRDVVVWISTSLL